MASNLLRRFDLVWPALLALVLCGCSGLIDAPSDAQLNSDAADAHDQGDTGVDGGLDGGADNAADMPGDPGSDPGSDPGYDAGSDPGPGDGDAGVDDGPADPCAGVDCSSHGQCSATGGTPSCSCDTGYHAEGLNCVKDDSPCDGQDCSGHGNCIAWSDGPVCACDSGYTPSTNDGLDCVPTEQVCTGGPIDYDYDNDGQNDSWFDPSDWECLQFELVNLTRATQDDGDAPECHKPLAYSVEWSAHGRNHSYKMKDQGGLFHDDFPWGQNCAYGCDPPCEIDMYMNGSNEPPCPDLSHHCNIMRCTFTSIGIGYVDTWNTQNFY